MLQHYIAGREELCRSILACMPITIGVAGGLVGQVLARPIFSAILVHNNSISLNTSESHLKKPELAIGKFRCRFS